MLDLSTAVLCDFAQVRDRLLFVSSGAVSRLYRRELPSPLGLMVGLIIEVPLDESGLEHTLRADVLNRHGDVLATLENTFRVGDEGLFPHEVQQVPLVLSITGVRARTWGTHQVRLSLDDELVRALTLYIVPAAGVAPVRAAAGEEQAAQGLQAVPDQPAADGADASEPDADAPASASDEPGDLLAAVPDPVEELPSDPATADAAAGEESVAGEAADDGETTDDEARWGASGGDSPVEDAAEPATGTESDGDTPAPAPGDGDGASAVADEAPTTEGGGVLDDGGTEGDAGAPSEEASSEGEADTATTPEESSETSESKERRGRFGRW